MMLKFVAIVAAFGAWYIPLPVEASREEHFVEDQNDVEEEEEQQQKLQPFEGIKKDIQEKLTQAAEKLVQSSVNQAELTKRVASNIAQYHNHVKNIGSTMGKVMKARSALTKAYHEDLKHGEESRVGALEVNLPEVLGEDYSLPQHDFSGSPAQAGEEEEDEEEAANGLDAQRQEAANEEARSQSTLALEDAAPASKEEAEEQDDQEGDTADNSEAISEDAVADDDVAEEQAQALEDPAEEDPSFRDDLAKDEEDRRSSSFTQVDTTAQEASDDAAADEESEDDTEDDAEYDTDAEYDDRESSRAQAQAVKKMSSAIEHRHAAARHQPRQYSKRDKLHRSRSLPRRSMSRADHDKAHVTLLNKLTPQRPHRAKASSMAHVASPKRIQKTALAVRPRSFTVDRRWAKHRSTRSQNP